MMSDDSGTEVTATIRASDTIITGVNEKAERKKRKRRNTNNPLSEARRQQQQTVSKSKKQLELENIWHRKSGAGYALFVSYYGGQPPGVVVMDTKEAPSISDQIKRRTTAVKGAGQSRAAKRRKKKKCGRGNNGSNHESCTAPSNNHNQEDKVVEESQLSSSPLFRALQTSSNNFTHLTPFLAALSKPLPLTFRLRSNCQSDEYEKLRDSLAAYPNLVVPVPFNPRIYQATSSSLSKSSLAKVSPSLKAMLVENSTNGTLARQELGSMLPVLALSGGGWLQQRDRVLDMCASPGSKTLQALEVVVSTVSDAEKNQKDPDSGKLISKRGRVVANDIHLTRLQSLQEAVARSGLSSFLTSRVTFTNFDASVFPFPTSGKLFDAIIADVPCSGDGTIRKDKHVLPMWTPATGNALHGLQLRILVRALELVKVGGVVCYSTCSLNPVEDEAVVAAALMAVQKEALEGASIAENSDLSTEEVPAVELIEWPRHLLPGLVRQNGVSSWNVADYTDENDGNKNNEENDEVIDLRWHYKYSDAVSAGMAHMEKTLWPPSIDNLGKINRLHLERCTRLWPQDQDTGGFFLALLRKNRQLHFSV